MFKIGEVFAERDDYFLIICQIYLEILATGNDYLIMKNIFLAINQKYSDLKVFFLILGQFL